MSKRRSRMLLFAGVALLVTAGCIPVEDAPRLNVELDVGGAVRAAGVPASRAAVAARLTRDGEVSIATTYPLRPGLAGMSSSQPGKYRLQVTVFRCRAACPGYLERARVRGRPIARCERAFEWDGSEYAGVTVTMRATACSVALGGPVRRTG